MFNEVTEVKCDRQGHSPPTQSQSKTPHDVLDHSSQPRWEEQSDRPQNAHQHKHPEEYSINHHGNIFPVFPHLVGEKRDSFVSDIMIYFPLMYFPLRIDFLDDYFPVRPQCFLGCVV